MQPCTQIKDRLHPIAYLDRPTEDHAVVSERVNAVRLTRVVDHRHRRIQADGDSVAIARAVPKLNIAQRTVPLHAMIKIPLLPTLLEY